MDWRPACIAPDQPDGWVLLQGTQGFVQGATGPLFSRDWVRSQGFQALSEHGLGHWRGAPLCVMQLADSVPLPANCEWVSLRRHLLEGDGRVVPLLNYASQIVTWAEEHRFCGRCGQPQQAAEDERAMCCEQCATRQYPRLSPSMIVLVTRGDEVLLARSPRFAPGVYSTLAGFVEPAESVEQCVIREIREEVGLEIRNLRYQGSQSWPFPHSLMLGFHADYAGGEIVPQPEEIEDARWFALDALPPLPKPGSISRYLIDLYLARRSGSPEPVLPG